MFFPFQFDAVLQVEGSETGSVLAQISAPYCTLMIGDLFCLVGSGLRTKILNG